VVSLLVNALITGAISQGVLRALQGEAVDLVECVRTGLRLFVPILAVSVMFSAMITVGLVLVVPAAFFFSMFILTIPALVNERLSILASFRRSRALTRGHRWTLFMCGFALVLSMVGIGVVAGLLLAVFADLGRHYGEFVLSLIGVLMVPLLTAWPTTAYYLIRVQREGGRLAELGAVFE
jgi:hypothetical protein